MKPFDLEAAKDGAKVCTRDGRKARIVCFDLKGHVSHPLLVLVESGAREDQQQAMVDGRHYNHEETRHDLFMAEPETPEGWTPYDPNVLPLENAEELEMMYGNKSTCINRKDMFFAWNEYNSTREYKDKRIAYRVTKWKEEKPSLETIIKDICLLSGIEEQSAMEELLRQFAEAIKKEGV